MGNDSEQSKQLLSTTTRQSSRRADERADLVDHLIIEHSSEHWTRFRHRDTARIDVPGNDIDRITVGSLRQACWEWTDSASAKHQYHLEQHWQGDHSGKFIELLFVIHVE